MIDRLRALLNRPIGEEERRRVFILALTVIAAAAALLIATRPDHHGPSPQRPTADRTQSAPPVPARPVENPAYVPVPAPEGGTAPEHLPAAPAAHAAQRFLAGYLPYIYGHGSAQAITGVTPALGRELSRHRPRVSPAQRQRHARVVTFRGQPGPRNTMLVTALIDDDGGVARYPIQMLVSRHRGGRWLVTQLPHD